MNESSLYLVGDVISTVDKKDIRVITAVTKDHYLFMNLKTITGDNIDIRKGVIGSQPKQIVERHFAIIEL